MKIKGADFAAISAKVINYRAMGFAKPRTLKPLAITRTLLEASLSSIRSTLTSTTGPGEKRADTAKFIQIGSRATRVSLTPLQPMSVRRLP
jgi:hypothetical protein